jgi:hypothetical protein
MVHQSPIRRMRDAPEQNGVLIVDEHLESLPGFQTHLLLHRTGQGNLAFLGENGDRGERSYTKIPSAQRVLDAFPGVMRHPSALSLPPSPLPPPFAENSVVTCPA